MSFEDPRHVFVHLVRPTDINFAQLFCQAVLYLFVKSILLELKMAENIHNFLLISLYFHHHFEAYLIAFAQVVQLVYYCWDQI